MADQQPEILQGLADLLVPAGTPSGYFYRDGSHRTANTAFNRFSDSGTALFGNGSSTNPFGSPILTRFNPSPLFMRLFMDGGMAAELGTDDNGHRTFTTDNQETIAEMGSAGTWVKDEDHSKGKKYTGQNAYDAYMYELNNKAPFRGYWALMDLLSISIWAAIVFAISKKAKVALPVVAVLMAIDQIDMVVMALAAFKTMKVKA